MNDIDNEYIRFQISGFGSAVPTVSQVEKHLKAHCLDTMTIYTVTGLSRLLDRAHCISDCS